jgi:hypothetical protein
MNWKSNKKFPLIGNVRGPQRSDNALSGMPRGTDVRSRHALLLSGRERTAHE